jgi:hypothetical protein
VVVVAEISRGIARRGPRFLTDGRLWEIPIGIWRQSGIDDWHRVGNHYRPDWKQSPKARLNLPRLIVSLADIELFYREPIDERFLSILKGYAANAKLPPIWVREQGAGGTGKPFVLVNGFHRFHSSLAVGFTSIPVEVLPPEGSPGRGFNLDIKSL